MTDKPLIFRLKSLNNQIRRLLDRNALFENDACLTGMQYGILGYLAEKTAQRDVHQRDVEAEFNIRRSTASQMLKLLEQQGFITRTYDTVDTRLKKIELTEKAKELDKKAAESINELENKLTAGIPAEELEQFCLTLKKLSDNAKEQGRL